MKDTLEKYFFSFVDRGLPAEETPLLTGTFEGCPLADAFAQDFPQYQPDQIAFLIECARKEVEL